MKEIFTQLAERIGERPIGTEQNRAALDLLTRQAEKLGYQVEEIPLSCRTWRRNTGFLEFQGARIPLHPGPFSRPVEGSFPVRAAESVEELERQELEGATILLHGALAGEPLMPKEFPFYYPEEHRRILELLEERRPAAVVALTGKHPMSGQEPYPLFEDGALSFPNAYASRASVDLDAFGSLGPLGTVTAGAAEGATARAAKGAAAGATAATAKGAAEGPGEGAAAILIDSATAEVSSRQPIYSLPGAEPRIVVCAHIDTKYGTPGAIDNAGGVAAMVGVMERLRGAQLGCRVEFVPFNGEEYYGVAGQLAYLQSREPTAQTTRLVVNLDGLGYPGSQNGVSLYNANDELAGLAERAMERAGGAVPGEEWVAGDHSIFAFTGIPCVAVTSSPMGDMLAITHTEADTAERVDPGLLEAAADFASSLVREVASR